MSYKDPQNQRLLNAFIADHSPLINKHIAILRSKNMIPPHIEDGDLHTAGVMGLMDALHKYDPSVAANIGTKEGDNPFAKYAESRIRGKILDHLASQDAVPKAARQKAKVMEANKNIMAAAEAAPQETEPTVKLPQKP